MDGMKAADMARYVIHRLNVDRYAQLAANGVLTMAEAVDAYDRAMENAAQVMLANNYENNMRDMARGGAVCIEETFNIIKAKGIVRDMPTEEA